MKITQHLLLLLFLLLPAMAFSQSSQKVIIKGQVVDSLTNEAISYATLRVTREDKPSILEKAAPTDDAGKFSFEMTKKGTFVLNIQYLGKELLTQTFTVGDNKVIDLGKILLIDNQNALKEVVVSAQRPLVKVDMDKITYSLEDDPDSKTNTVMDMLKKVPMVTVDGEDNIELKGSSSFKIYVNGKPSNMISSNPKDVLKSMPANTVKNIEVITDPGAKYDAEGLAGIINIITQQNTSMGGYTATLNGKVDTRGGFGAGAYLSFKQGKFGFTGNFNHYDYKSSWGKSSSLREALAPNPGEAPFLKTDGRSKHNGNGQYGSGELSYEIDTLNLINVGFSRYGGKGKSRSRSIRQLLTSSDAVEEEYHFFDNTGYTYGSTGFNVDYQRTSAKVKERLLTLSYRFNVSPDDRSTNYYEDDIIRDILSQRNDYSDGDTKEHTFQIDYTTPFAKKHTLELGAKYILRLSESTSGKDIWNASTDDWTSIHTDNDRFKHEQDIISAYASYSLKLNQKWGFKTGLRYEATDVKGKYPRAKEDNFKTDYSNFVPSATISYQLTPAQTLRLGYNMRISRPGIWQLNPFVNSIDSSYISYGNPKLDAVKSHNVNLNYSLFKPKFNMNSSLSYNAVNNSVEQTTILEDNVSKSTYANVGKIKRLSLFTYFNWTITSKLRFNTNMSGDYSDLKGLDANGNRLSNSGFGGRVHGNVQFTLPKDFKLSGSGGYSAKQVNLSGKGISYHYHSFSIAKSFIQDKLNFNVSAFNPFMREMKFRSNDETPTYRLRSESFRPSRAVSFTVSYRFGEMKSQIKKTTRSISNDDSMGGGNASAGGQGAQGGGN